MLPNGSLSQQTQGEMLLYSKFILFLSVSAKLIILYGNEAWSEARLVTSPFIARGINLVYLLWGYVNTQNTHIFSLLSFSLFHKHTHTLSLSLLLSISFTHTHTLHSLSLFHIKTLVISLTLTHIHAQRTSKDTIYIEQKKGNTTL